MRQTLVEIYLEDDKLIITDYHEIRKFNPELNTLITVEEFDYREVTYTIKEPCKIDRENNKHIVKVEIKNVE